MKALKMPLAVSSVLPILKKQCITRLDHRAIEQSMVAYSKDEQRP